ncbi:hypothetical protein [Psychrobacillus sp.]|uniref:hypothetical protein n=1 Tax=Psychrobacillus sp. TaxID=1871623 RepID=UPI0028BE553F|nr:hypothetical protein [Psychrobacillus sp.]
MINSIVRFIGILMVASPVLLYGQNIVGEKAAIMILIVGIIITFLFRKNKK